MRHGAVSAIGHALGAGLLIMLALAFAVAEDFAKEPWWWISRVAVGLAFVAGPSALVWLSRRTRR